MKIIPAIDLLDGNAVRLEKGDYAKVTVFHNQPVKLADRFLKAGFQHIHIVDLNGAREGRFVNLPLILKIQDETGVSIQTGGGIRTYADCEHLLNSGISSIVCTSMAVKNRDDWYRALDKFADRCILGMDLKNGRIAYSGWTRTADEDIDSFLTPMIDRGLHTVLCTDISRDGMLSGANVDLYKQMMNRYPNLQFIASGGVAGENDLKLLSGIQIYGTVVGRAYYDGLLDLKTMIRYHDSGN